MAFTFTTLKTAIQDYTDNAESTFVSQLTRFILNAEERILKECQLEDFRKNVTGSATQSSKFLTKPTDFLAPFSLSALNYTMELHYFYRPQSITASSDGTSYLGTNAELCLLYGSLVEAYTFMKGEPDLLQLYNARYMESLQWLKNLGEAEQTHDQYRYDSIRKPPQ